MQDIARCSAPAAKAHADCTSHRTGRQGVSQGRAPCGMALSGTRRSKGGSCSKRALMPRWNTARSAKPTGRRKAAGPLKTAPSAPTVRLRSVTPGCPGVQAVCGPRQTCATSAARAAAPSA